MGSSRLEVRSEMLEDYYKKLDEGGLKFEVRCEKIKGVRYQTHLLPTSNFLHQP